VAAQDNDEASPPPRKRRKKRDSSKSVVVISAIPEIPPVDQDGVNRENGGDLERSDPSDYEWELETEMYADHPLWILTASLIIVTAQSQKMKHYVLLQRKGFLRFQPRKAPS
jgi:hypothetical protein